MKVLQKPEQHLMDLKTAAGWFEHVTELNNMQLETGIEDLCVGSANDLPFSVCHKTSCK